MYKCNYIHETRGSYKQAGNSGYIYKNNEGKNGMNWKPEPCLLLHISSIKAN